MLIYNIYDNLFLKKKLLVTISGIQVINLPPQQVAGQQLPMVNVSLILVFILFKLPESVSDVIGKPSSDANWESLHSFHTNALQKGMNPHHSQL